MINELEMGNSEDGIGRGLLKCIGQEKKQAKPQENECASRVELYGLTCYCVGRKVLP
jgi:hypothetical protein